MLRAFPNHVNGLVSVSRKVRTLDWPGLNGSTMVYGIMSPIYRHFLYSGGELARLYPINPSFNYKKVPDETRHMTSYLKDT